MNDASPTANEARASGERHVRALPVIAISVLLLAVAGILLLGRFGPRPVRPTIAMTRHPGEPMPVQDVDHYVPGSPPGVCERFLRVWMRARYDEARDLSTGAMRERAEHELAEVGAFTAAQMEEYRHTRAYVDATHYDLEHVEMRDLPPGPDGLPRKEVQGQAHAYGDFDGTHVDSRRGQTFTLVLVNGAWRVADRSWETFN